MQIEPIELEAAKARCAHVLAKAKWAGDSRALPDDAEVDVLAVDPAGRASLRVGLQSGTPGSTACWIRWWEGDSPFFRSCDLADLEMPDEDFDRLIAARPDDSTSLQKAQTMQIEQIDRDAVDDWYGHPAIDDRLAQAFAIHRHTALAARPDDSEAVERVAKALHEHDNPDAIAWEDFSDGWKAIYRLRARAAIAAMRGEG